MLGKPPGLDSWLWLTSYIKNYELKGFIILSKVSWFKKHKRQVILHKIRIYAVRQGK